MLAFGVNVLASVSCGLGGPAGTPLANECYNGRFQNGDLDFDGQSYLPDWPDGSPNHPTTFQYIGPFTGRGHTYPLVQFETDAARLSRTCVTS